jgi:hypothetical protein
LRLTASSASKRPRRRARRKKSFSRTPVCCAHISWSNNHPFHSSSFSEVPDGNKKNRQHCNLQPHFLQALLCRFCKNLSRPSSLLPCNRQPLFFQLLNSKAGSQSPLGTKKTKPRPVPEAIPLPPCFSENRRYYPMKCSFG